MEWWIVNAQLCGNMDYYNYNSMRSLQDISDVNDLQLLFETGTASDIQNYGELKSLEIENCS